MVAVSSCLAGIVCRYNVANIYNAELMNSIGGDYIPICPELLAGFGVPRVPFEIVGGSGEDVLDGHARVFTKDGTDITDAVISGAEMALQICIKKGVIKAYLQHRSPTCGCGHIYDGTFSGAMKPGNGVFTALLNKNGIETVVV